MITTHGEPQLVEIDVTFRAVDAGPDIAAVTPSLFATAWPAYRTWFLQQGEAARASYATGAQKLREHMPELVPAYDALVDAVGGGDLEARFLSHWCPPPLFAACSLATWTRDHDVLVRNYDFPPLLCDNTLLASRWLDTRVLAMSDCAWGALDGVNEHGLAVAIAFGGREVVGEGFGIGLIVRYVLQVAHDVDEALDVLRRVPVRLAYNVALVDASGGSAIAYMSPDRPLAVSGRDSAANRQGATEWPQHAAFCATVEREDALATTLADPLTTAATLVQRFLEPPVHRSTALSTWGTVYTSAYDADRRTVELAWPDDRWVLPMEGFTEGTRTRRTSVLVPPESLQVDVPTVPSHPALIA